MTEQEIRADFAQKLQRRFEGMRKSALNRQSAERWQQATHIVALTLADANGVKG